MSRAHVSNIIIVVHHFILQALRIACPVSSTWTELLSFIIPRLRWIYARALHRTSLLVTSEIYRHFSIGPARLQHTLHSLLEIFTGGTAEATLDALFEGDYGLEGTPVWESLTPVEQESCVIVHHVVYVKCHDSRRFILDLIKRDVVGLNLLSGPSSAINVVRSTLIQSMEVDDIDLIGADDFDSSSEFTREDLRFKLGILRRSLDILESAGQVCAHTTESGRHADAQRRENLGHTAMDVDED